MAKSLPKVMQWVTFYCAGTASGSRTPATEAPTVGAQMLQIDSKGSVEFQRVTEEPKSSHVPLRPPCDTEVVNFDFLHAKSLTNNLGGQGPGTGPNYIRLGGIGNFSGEVFDMKIETMNEDYKVANPSLNHARGHVVQINVATTREARLKFSIVKPETEELVTLPAFYISVFDIDQSGLSGEQVLVTGYDDVIIPEDKEYDVEDIEGGKMMTSKIFGRSCDNPWDPWNLSIITCYDTTVDTRKRSFTMLFKDASSFELTFKVPLLNSKRSPGSDGRNLLFAGPSAMTQPCVQQLGDAATTTTTTPQCDPDAVYLDFSQVKVKHNNLGGMGPDGGEKCVRYAQVGNFTGNGVDSPRSGPIDVKVATLNPDFSSTNSGWRIRKNKMGVINVGAGSEADLQFTFVWAGTDDEVVLPAFYVTVLDLDIGPVSGESATVSGYDRIIYSPDHEFDVQDSETGKILTATKRGNGCDNPTDPMDLPVIECDGFVVDTHSRAFTMLYKNASTFRLGFKATIQKNGEEKLSKDGGSRNLFWTFMSALTSACPQSPGTK